ncbi:MAG TPA: (d)CMP kinase [Thermoanaerobacterales bacterium]|nr:(d)CMP kinase [Thermoanaerobacterales bacterium]
MNFNIAIDGPAGAGKSTVAKIIADKLNMVYVDTGAMYRAITYLSIKEGKTAIEEIINLAKNADIKLHGRTIFINNEDVSLSIRSQEINNNVSKIAKIPEIRVVMTEIQRKIAKNKGVVMDGRDIGTHVLPDAEYKFYLTASLKERATRRYFELLNYESNVSLEQIEMEIAQRDRQDEERAFSPLKIAKDAVIIDTTNKTIMEVVKELLDYVKRGEGFAL